MKENSCNCFRCLRNFFVCPITRLIKKLSDSVRLFFRDMQFWKKVDKNNENDSVGFLTTNPLSMPAKPEYESLTMPAKYQYKSIGQLPAETEEEIKDNYKKYPRYQGRYSFRSLDAFTMDLLVWIIPKNSSEVPAFLSQDPNRLVKIVINKSPMGQNPSKDHFEKKEHFRSTIASVESLASLAKMTDYLILLSKKVGLGLKFEIIEIPCRKALLKHCTTVKGTEVVGYAKQLYTYQKLEKEIKKEEKRRIKLEKKAEERLTKEREKLAKAKEKAKEKEKLAKAKAKEREKKKRIKLEEKEAKARLAEEKKRIKLEEKEAKAKKLEEKKRIKLEEK